MSAVITLLISAINCSEVNWHVTDSSIQGEVEGLFSNATATHKSQTHVSAGGRNVSFTGLYPGATYTIALLYEKNWDTFMQCNHDLTISESESFPVFTLCNGWAEWSLRSLRLCCKSTVLVSSSASFKWALWVFSSWLLGQDCLE